MQTKEIINPVKIPILYELIKTPFKDSVKYILHHQYNSIITLCQVYFTLCKIIYLIKTFIIDINRMYQL